MPIFMALSLRKKFIASFLIVVFLTGTVATWVGIHFIGQGIIRQAQEKVRMDLNSAREIYRENLNRINYVVNLTAIRFFLKEGLTNREYLTIQKELDRVRKTEGLDVLTLTDSKGRVIYRTSNPKKAGDILAEDEILSRVLSKNKPVASTQIVSRDNLIREGQDLADRAWIKMIPTAKSKFRPDSIETAGMMMKAAAPVPDNSGNLIGVLYGGILINRNYTIVDKIKNTVYQGQMYKNKDIGTATIFQKDLRISTNVIGTNGERAIGTRVSEEVYNQVLEKGLPWFERAFVVNNWYMTAYEPIRNIQHQIIGILYVGILEDKFVDLKNHTLLMFFGITLTGMVIAFAVSYLLANNLLKPISHLVYASKKLAQGDLSHQVQIESKDEIGELATTFNFMIASLKERDEKLKKHAQERIMESERLAMVGQLAAGVAHELNNPLGGILVYSHLLLEKLDKNDPKREQLEKIVTQSTRCKEIVKGLLDFSRQTEPRMELADVNKILNSALSLLEDQALFHNIKIEKDMTLSLPKVMLDSAQIQQVFINILLNSAESIERNGNLLIRTQLSQNKQFVEIELTDTGCGISEENIKKLFDPFFTTKDVGKGTGLGLSVSYGIIQRHAGNIIVKSKEGKGTTFIIQLPIQQVKSKKKPEPDNQTKKK